MSDPAPSPVRSAGVVGGFTAASRLLGMVRDQLIAARLGTGPEASAFVVAFTVPNLFRRLFGEGALSASFLPRFVRARERGGEAEAWTLARRVSSVAAAALLLACAAGVGVALLLPRLRPDLGAHARLTLELAEIMLPYTVFICLAALAMGVLNALHHYAAPAAAQMVLNVTMIAALLGVCPFWAGDAAAQVRVLALAVLVAGALQLLLQGRALRAHGWRPGWEPAFRDPATREVLRALAPAAAAAAVTQLNLLLDRLMAGFIGAQAPAALYFSERLVYLPLGVFAVAAGQVLLPALSRLAARDEAEQVRRQTRTAMCLMAFLMLPAAAGLAALAFPITRLVYGHGAFAGESVAATAVALMAYAPGLLVFSLDKMLVPVFLAHHDARTPLRAGLAAVLLNLALNLGCLALLPARWAVAGLAASTVVAHAAYVLALARGVHKRFGNCGWAGIAGSILRCAAAAAIMAACALWVWRTGTGTLGTGTGAQLVATLGAVLAGIACYGGIAALFRFPEWQWVRGAWRR